MFTIQFTIVDGPDEGSIHEFNQKEIIAGSSFLSDMILVHPEVSSKHFRIVEDKEEIYLEDLAGNNETKLNGLFVSREPLHNGDELQVGPYVFHISLIRDIQPEMIDTGDPSALSKLQPKRLSISWPPLLVLILLILVASVYGTIYFFTLEREGRDLSELGPLRLPVKGIFGYKVGERNYRDKVEFTFVPRRPKYRLQYRPGYINQAGLVKIFVNEIKLANVPLTIDRWSDDLVTIEIPQSSLRKDEENIIKFDNTKNPPETISWGIQEVSIHEVPLPKCDVDVAKKYLRLANEKYEEKRINEENLYYAIKYLKEGSEFVVACEDEQIKNFLKDTMDLYEDELMTLYDTYVFNFRKFMKLKDINAAIYELEMIRKFIPEESDSRNRKARDFLDKIDRRLSN